MNSERKLITICMGSSCFARGNKRILGIIQDFISRRKLDDKVHFKGNHCFGKCKEGPTLMIDDQEYAGVSEETVLEILEKELGIQ